MLPCGLNLGFFFFFFFPRTEGAEEIGNIEQASKGELLLLGNASVCGRYCGFNCCHMATHSILVNTT